MNLTASEEIKLENARTGNNSGTSDENPMLLYPIPDDELANILKGINENVAAWKDGMPAAQSLGYAVKAALEIEDFLIYLEENEINHEVATVAHGEGIIRHLFYYYLTRDRLAEAALVCWGPDIFSPLAWTTRLVWGALTSNSLVNVMGCSSSGKTYSSAAYFLLQYVADPEWTNILLVAQKFETLKKVLFADMVRLFQGSIIKFPGEIESEAIAVDKKTAMGIRCEAVRAGAGNGSLKGRKRKNRPKHPKYGTQSRLFIIADEAQEIPSSFFEVVVNLIAGLKGNDDEKTRAGGKLVMAANPADRFSNYGINCEPTLGWDTLDMNADAWDSLTGFRIVRLNGLKTENVKTKRSIFSGQFSYSTYIQTLKAVGGDVDHPRMWTYVYGMFPPQGESGTIVSPDHVAASNKFWNFMGNTERFAALDPAYTGDDAAFSWGTSGKAVSYTDLRGDEVKLDKPKYCLQVENVISLPKGDTYKLAISTMEKLASLGIVNPMCFGIDISGSTGTKDIIEVEWNKRVRKLKPSHPDYNKRVNVRGLHFSSKPTEKLILAEDINTPYELYNGLASEMWFATSKWFSVGCVGLSREVDLRTRQELTARKGIVSTKAKRSRVESKDEYKSRGNRSPDFADSFVMLVQTCRAFVDWKPGWVEETKSKEENAPIGPIKWELSKNFGFSNAPKAFKLSLTD